MSSKHNDSRSSWLHKQLECFKDNRVVFFMKGGIHVEGTIRRVRKDFVELIPQLMIRLNALRLKATKTAKR